MKSTSKRPSNRISIHALSLGSASLVLAGLMLVGLGNVSAATMTEQFPKKVQFALGLSWWQKPYDQGVAGSCEALLAAVSEPRGNHDYMRLIVLGEMHDRGVCVPIDPAAAYGYFMEVVETTRRLGLLRVAWKLWHGHGVSQDQEGAVERIKEFLALQTLFTEKYLNGLVENRLKELPHPPPLTTALSWIQDLRVDEGTYTDWAADLFLGRALFYDGSLMPKSEESARDILLFEIDSRYSKFRYGEVRYQSAENEEDIKDALSYLHYGTHCGYLPTLFLKIEIYSDDRYPGIFSETNTYIETLLAAHHGGDVAALLKEQRRNFSDGTLFTGESFALMQIGQEACLDSSN